MSPTSPPETTSSRQKRNQSLSTFAALTAVVAFLLVMVTIVAVSSKTDTTTTSTSSGPVAVTLTEFAITPKAMTATAGNVQLAIKNNGTMTHNLSIAELGKKSPDIAPGQGAVLDLGDVKAGTYQVQCDIPGHADSGMKGTLTVTAAGSSSDAAMAGMDMSTTATDASSDPNDPTKLAEESQAMLDSFKPFPATTAGKGNVPLDPTIEADGTKVFNLTAAITDWEVEPGKTVKAWSYNGTVPGPLLKVNVGDQVKVILKNGLPGASTDLHLHGVDVPFAMDGVAPITQDAIKPGDSFTYEFTPTTIKMGMYHAHLMGEMAVTNGLFGVFQVGEQPLPAGRTVSGIAIPRDVTIAQEMPMVLNDAGVIGLSLDGKSFPATAPIVAKSGDWIEVTYFNEGLQMHTMHLHRFPQIIISKDGLPLDSPYAADTIAVGPGERYTVLIHPDEVGTWVWHCHILNHVERSTGMFGMVTALVVQ
ncbi:MAG: multicopper oxidase domain-containing protein [Acidimicrobiales bacterium]